MCLLYIKVNIIKLEITKLQNYKITKLQNLFFNIVYYINRRTC